MIRVFTAPTILGSVSFDIKYHPTDASENLLAAYRGVEQRGELNNVDDKNVQNWVSWYQSNRPGWKVKPDRFKGKTVKKLEAD